MKTLLRAALLTALIACQTGVHSGLSVLGESHHADAVVSQLRAQRLIVHQTASRPGVEAVDAVTAEPLLAASNVEAFETRNGRVRPIFAPSTTAATSPSNKNGFQALRHGASVSYPQTANGSIFIGDVVTGMRVDVSLVGAHANDASASNGYLVYPDVMGPGVDWLHLATLEGTTTTS